jgi:lipopolysaccharide/colanic/teichoic acid biosynthesis glycosyltransferase
LNSVDDYLKIQFDLCHGRLGQRACGEELTEGVCAQGPVSVSPDAVLVGPIILGAGVRIGARCRLIGPLVIGEDAQIREGAFLRESVVGKKVRLGRDSKVERSILTEGLGVPEGARITGSVATSESLSPGDLNLVERDLRVGFASLPITRFVQTGLRRGLYCGFKRMFDLAFAAGALLLSLPLMVAIALAIRWDSGGPVLFRQRRCGRNGKEFTMLKFRSMRADADQTRLEISHLNECDGPVFKINNDPRFTRVGRILRKYSLDELPQFWNILRGDMSVVGPRPLAESELRTCPSWRDARLRVKPGLTGLWQVSSREKKDFRDWIQLDLRYVREQSLSLDFTILLRTFAVLTRGL